jgi:hypothetical protein
MHARIGVLRALNRNIERTLTDRKEMHWGAGGSRGPAMTVLIHVNTSKQVGDLEHLKVFANVDAAETWFKENDPEGVARCDRMTSWRKSLRQITQRNIHRCPGRGTISEATSSDIAAGEIVSAAQRAMATSGPGVD